MIEESYVSFDTAKMLKEAGLRELTKTHYSNSGQIWETAMPADYNDDFNCNTCNRPTQALAARWLREVHHINVYACFDYERFDERKWIFTQEHTMVNDDSAVYCSITNYNSYEEALEAGLKHGLEMVKK